MKKRIVLCADDYGQAPAISQGILALLQAKRLSAVSCMVTTPYWQEHAQWLTSFYGQIDIGLHFNLTEGRSSLSTLMLQAIARRLDTRELVAELHTQLDNFEAALGCLPAFIDGHQHVHQFPLIRDALVTVYQQRLKASKAYIRVINAKLTFRDVWGDFKKIIVQVLGTKALRKQLLQHHIPHNQSFSGMYHFSNSADYAQLFPRFLQEITSGGLIMCHPGLAAPIEHDPIARAREAEYQYLRGEQFINDCAAQGIEVARFYRD